MIEPRIYKDTEKHEGKEGNKIAALRWQMVSHRFHGGHRFGCGAALAICVATDEHKKTQMIVRFAYNCWPRITRIDTNSCGASLAIVGHE